MNVSHFERLQIACHDFAPSLEEYSLLLNQAPEFVGEYSVTDVTGEQIEQGASAWFVLENMVIELYSRKGQGPSQRAKISSILLAGEVNTSDGRALTYRYRAQSGNEFNEHQYLLSSGKDDAYQVKIMGGFKTARVEKIDNVVYRVDHLVLMSNDAEHCIERFGEKGLGMRLALDKEAPKWGGRMLFFRCANMTLEVMVKDDKSKNGDHFWGIAYESRNLNACAAHMHDQGISLSEIRGGRKPGTVVATIKSHCLEIPTLLLQVGKCA